MYVANKIDNKLHHVCCQQIIIPNIKAVTSLYTIDNAVCETMSDNGSEGSHKHTSWTMVSSAVALYINKGSRSNSWGVMPRDKPSNVVLRMPGICSASARFAFRCIDIVVKIMLAFLANTELTLSDCAHANELLLSPCKS